MSRPSKKLIAQVCRRDPVIAKIIRDRGFRSVPQRNGSSFERLARAIVGQQVSVAAARSIWGRLVDLVGTRGRLSALAASKATLGRLKKAGLSRQKASYIKNLGKECLGSKFDVRSFKKLSDEEAVAKLTALHGVGPWTAQMFLIFRLGRENVLATGDVGLQNGIKLAYGLRKPPSELFWQKAAKNWAPIQASISWQLWEFYNDS